MYSKEKPFFTPDEQLSDEKAVPKPQPTLADLQIGSTVNLSKDSSCKIISIGPRSINLRLNGRSRGSHGKGPNSPKKFSESFNGKTVQLCGHDFTVARVAGRMCTITINEVPKPEYEPADGCCCDGSEECHHTRFD